MPIIYRNLYKYVPICNSIHSYNLNSYLAQAQCNIQSTLCALHSRLNLGGSLFWGRFFFLNKKKIIKEIFWFLSNCHNSDEMNYFLNAFKLKKIYILWNLLARTLFTIFFKKFDFFFSAAKLALKQEFMFQNVAYRLTVYSTGSAGNHTERK